MRFGSVGGSARHYELGPIALGAFRARAPAPSGRNLSSRASSRLAEHVYGANKYGHRTQQRCFTFWGHGPGLRSEVTERVVRTLDDLCTFIGFRVGALAVARISGETQSRLGVAGSMIKGFRDQSPTSLARLIAAVQNLPHLTLDARLLSERRGEHPYLLRVRLSRSPGIVWSTRIEYVIGGSAHGGDRNFGAGGGDVSPTQLTTGVWEIVAIREGIGQFGLAVLRQSLGKVEVFRRPGPSPATPMPPVAPPAVALVTCGSLDRR